MLRASIFKPIPQIYVMLPGLPCTGKSTWREEIISRLNIRHIHATVLSADDAGRACRACMCSPCCCVGSIVTGATGIVGAIGLTLFGCASIPTVAAVDSCQGSPPCNTMS